MLLLSLLLIHSVLKIIFYQYNKSLLLTGDQHSLVFSQKMRLLGWSFATDLFVLLGINAALLLLLTAADLVTKKISPWFAILSGWILVPIFTLINTFAVILNLADIFYFRFHFQRANADLFFVLDHPLNRLLQQPLYLIVLSIILLALILLWLFKLHLQFFRAFIGGNNGRLITALLFIALLSLLFTRQSSSKWLVPAYPMVVLPADQLPFVQNSLHTFLYSCFRNGRENLHKNYLANAEADSLISLRKKLSNPYTGEPQKNIVLFIMESVPYDFFDSSSPYKVNMPFLDSLLQHSRFFSQAFCYDHESNKGITALLAGVPTVSDVPLYHSAHVTIPVTRIGSALKTRNYHSLFCIGDEYDNFGFAKFSNWMGFGRYYSEEDITGYKDLPKHSMGLQDEAVLRFLGQQLKTGTQPFFAVHYNISTHFPYDIPNNFAAAAPANYSAAMKAMQYYDHSLQQFFDQIKNEPWFANTTFIFCPDHWMFPEGKPGRYTAVSSYRIPLVIYDPQTNKKETDERLASQFDVAATVLSIAGYRDSIISYGNDLTDSSTTNAYVYSRSGNALFIVRDTEYALGFNAVTNKTEFLYHYKDDRQLKQDLNGNTHTAAVQQRLEVQVKAFLQKVLMQYDHRVQ